MSYPTPANFDALVTDLAVTLHLDAGLAQILAEGDQPAAIESDATDAVTACNALVVDLANTLHLDAGLAQILAVEGGNTALLDDLTAKLRLETGLQAILAPAPTPAVDPMAGLGVDPTGDLLDPVEIAREAGDSASHSIAVIARGAPRDRLKLRAAHPHRHLERALRELGEIQDCVREMSAAPADDEDISSLLRKVARVLREKNCIVEACADSLMSALLSRKGSTVAEQWMLVYPPETDMHSNATSTRDLTAEDEQIQSAKNYRNVVNTLLEGHSQGRFLYQTILKPNTDSDAAAQPDTKSITELLTEAERTLPADDYEVLLQKLREFPEHSRVRWLHVDSHGDSEADFKWALQVSDGSTINILGQLSAETPPNAETTDPQTNANAPVQGFSGAAVYDVSLRKFLEKRWRDVNNLPPGAGRRKLLARIAEFVDQPPTEEPDEHEHAHYADNILRVLASELELLRDSCTALLDTHEAIEDTPSRSHNGLADEAAAQCTELKELLISLWDAMSDFRGADLSEAVPGIDVDDLDGVRWSDDTAGAGATLWPANWRGEIEFRSNPLGHGVWEIRSGIGVSLTS